MNFNELLYSFTDSLRKTVNKIIKTNSKLAKCENAILFNGLCLKEDILPKFTNRVSAGKSTRLVRVRNSLFLVVNEINYPSLDHRRDFIWRICTATGKHVDAFLWPW